MYHYDYATSGTCSKVISLDLDGDVVRNVSFFGGCDGNLKAIPLLVEGMHIDEVVQKLEGVRCGRRPTSCAHQLTLAIKEAKDAMDNGIVQDNE